MRINIVTPPHTKFAAICLANSLTELGHDVYVQGYIEYNDTLHIIYCAGAYHAMPKNYILYQTEVHSSHWFNVKYLGFIRKAKAVWEYQEGNMHKYQHLNKNIHLLPPSIMPQPPQPKDIDCLFYGTVKGSKHREHWLKELEWIKTLQPYADIRVVHNTLENDIWKLLARTKTVLNIHYYKDAPLEIFRINEALSFGCNVISETSSNTGKYDGLVQFADTPQKMAALMKLPPNPVHMNTLNSLFVCKYRIKKLLDTI